jgi:NADH-quinone oxidoreductase subunit C
MANENITVNKLSEKFAGEIIEVLERPGDCAVVMKKDKILEICRFLCHDPGLSYKYLMDICGVDYLAMGKAPRFAVVYHLFSLERRHRIRLKVPLEEGDLSLDSVVEVWKGAEWFEREAFDLFGIEFKNHPFLRRILTHQQFIGHALRKDYPLGKRHLCTEVWDLEIN